MVSDVCFSSYCNNINSVLVKRAFYVLTPFTNNAYYMYVRCLLFRFLPMTYYPFKTNPFPGLYIKDRLFVVKFFSQI